MQDANLERVMTDHERRFEVPDNRCAWARRRLDALGHAPTIAVPGRGEVSVRRPVRSAGGTTAKEGAC